MPVVVIVGVRVAGRLVVFVLGRLVVSVVSVGRAHLTGSVRVWWCRGVPPRECSAWNIASETS